MNRVKEKKIWYIHIGSLGTGSLVEILLVLITWDF
jgi:hypothetical protein